MSKTETLDTAAADPMKPAIALLVKLGSIAVHAEEFLSPTGHRLDQVVIDGLINDPEVKQWVHQMTKMGLLPVKR